MEGEDIKYISPLDDFDIDPEDFSPFYKKEFDDKDKARLKELNSTKIFSKVKAKIKRAELGTKDLRR